MIRAIIERNVKPGVDLFPLLKEIRIAAVMHYQGYLGGETLANTEDSSNIIVVSTWETFEDWEHWAVSETRTKLYQKIEPLLREKSKVRTFQVMATEHKPVF